MPRSNDKEKKMDLILWRHAEAEDAAGDLPDARRRLSARGQRQAIEMGQWLKKRLPKNVRILVSPTKRTQMTAHALGLPFEIESAIGPDAAATDVLSAAGWPRQRGAVLVVGHQPTLGRVAALLLSGAEADWSIKKGAVWWISARAGVKGPATVLRMALGPDAL